MFNIRVTKAIKVLIKTITLSVTELSCRKWDTRQASKKIQKNVNYYCGLRSDNQDHKNESGLLCNLKID